MDEGSVTQWISQIKDGGDSVAEQELWNRYFPRLVALVQKKLDDLPPDLRDDEDVALSVLNCLFWRAGQGGFPELHDRTELWQLLAKIAVRKAIDRRRAALAEKRGLPQLQRHRELEELLRGIAGEDPPPDLLASVREEYQRLMSALSDELRVVAQMKLEGYTNAEIADALGRVERTIERKLRVIRHMWLRAVE